MTRATESRPVRQDDDAGSGSLHVGPGKSHRDENFPVASRVIHPRHRAPILAFYGFVRAADDVADHPTLTPAEKHARLDRLEGALTGHGAEDPAAEPLRIALVQRGLAPRHALDLLAAFRLDVDKNRYETWSELIGYCSLSAMPVGRFVLDVHGESQATWPTSDALCAALQVINHLQDCAEDYRNLDRVYLPLDVLAQHGAPITALEASRASPPLRGALRALAQQTADLLQESAPLPDLVADHRLSLEIAAIRRLAGVLVGRLIVRDPLSEPVHLSKGGFALVAATGIAGALGRRILRRSRAPAGARA